MLKLYGHYISQPSRSVLWLLKIHNAQYEFINTNPTKGDTKTSTFKSKFPLQRIPVIEDDTNGFTLAESSAIMIYLCEKNKWIYYYPNDLHRRAKIHEYLSCHGEKTRRITIHSFRPIMLHAMGKEGSLDESTKIKSKQVMSDVGTWFQDTYLSSSRYITGNTPTIADLSAYTELSQGPLMLDYNYDHLPRLREWLYDMAHEVPFHDDVHRSVFKLRDIIQIKKNEVSKL